MPLYIYGIERPTGIRHENRQINPALLRNNPPLLENNPALLRNNPPLLDNNPALLRNKPALIAEPFLFS
jgi:hypothetical protein